MNASKDGPLPVRYTADSTRRTHRGQVAPARRSSGSATGPGSAGAGYTEVAGPREESLVEMARLLAARRGYPSKIEGVTDESDPDHEINVNGGLLPGPDAILAGPTFAKGLESAP